MTFIFLLLLNPALKAVDGGSRKPHHVMAALAALALDLVLARTVWRLIAGPLQGRERTISDTLERLCKDGTHPDVSLFIAIARKINRESPTGDHIKAVL